MLYQIPRNGNWVDPRTVTRVTATRERVFGELRIAATVDVVTYDRTETVVCAGDEDAVDMRDEIAKAVNEGAKE